MRAFVDWIKDIIKVVDSMWIRSAGSPIRFFANHKVPEGKIIYGFYDWPQRSRYIYGIDSPNEMVVQIELAAFAMAGMVGSPVGKKLAVEDATWQIVDWCFIRNKFLGKYRIALVVKKYEEHSGNGIHMKTSHGIHMEMNDDAQNGY